MDDISHQLQIVEGYTLLGMHQEACEVLNQLSTAERMRPDAIKTRLLLLRRMGMWSSGVRIAQQFGPEDPAELREAVGLFHLAHAAELCAMGQIEAAQEAVERLKSIWPEGTQAVLATTGWLEGRPSG